MSRTLTLLTLVFPESTLGAGSALPPHAESVPMLNSSSIELLPSSRHLLSPISHEKTLAFSVPADLTEDFVDSVRELPVSYPSKRQKPESRNDGEEKRWLMSSIKGEAAGVHGTWSGRVLDAWTAFVDVLKVHT